MVQHSFIIYIRFYVCCGNQSYVLDSQDRRCLLFRVDVDNFNSFRISRQHLF
ncbi:hypothetical protein [Yersinia phage vB_YenM_P778]